MPGQLSIEEQTTQNLMNAFRDTVEKLAQARATVDGARNDLAHWTGAAADRFRNGLQEITDGINNIGNGLNQISDDMARFAALTARTEDDAIAMAASASLASGSGGAASPAAGFAGASWT